MASCKSTGQKKDSNDPFITSLVEKKIGSSDFHISLPADYSVRQKGGPDFTVYYFSTADSTVKPAFSGGMYLGNFSTEFPPVNDSCKTTSIKSALMGKERDWKLFSCDSSFFVQTMIDNKKDESASRIHAFGRGNTKEDIQKMLKIFSTFK
jgi:hypothetical protein